MERQMDIKMSKKTNKQVNSNGLYCRLTFHFYKNPK